MIDRPIAGEATTPDGIRVVVFADTTTIALWLGHEQERTTRVYLHADLHLKQRVLDQATPPNGHPGRYRAPDRLLGFLDSI